MQIIPSRIKLVSIDMFGTLVDTGSIKYAVWQTFLKDRYTPELAERYWDRATELVFQYFRDKVTDLDKYISAVEIFEIAYRKTFEEIGLNFNPKEAAQILARQHSFSTPHEDALPFLKSVGSRYPICLSSDTDDEMLGQLQQLYPFDYVFTSQQIGAYKNSPDGKFFTEVFKHYNIKQEEILHIGDSSSDVNGAKRVGIISCWVNRKMFIRPEINPDYEVHSLGEVAGLLGVKV